MLQKDEDRDESSPPGSPFSSLQLPGLDGFHSSTDLLLVYGSILLLLLGGGGGGVNGLLQERLVLDVLASDRLDVLLLLLVQDTQKVLELRDCECLPLENQRGETLVKQFKPFYIDKNFLPNLSENKSNW